MPLDKNKKNSLNQKENRIHDKACLDTSIQGVPQSSFLSASLTVEAALVFPLFLFALVSVMFFFRVLSVTQITSEALASTGSFMSLAEEEDISLGKTIVYFYKELLEADCPFSVIEGGKAGIGWTGTGLEGEYVDLQIHYWCKLPVPLFGRKVIPVSQRVRMKKWTGYHEEGEERDEDDTWVYITQTGEVYHWTKECSHLKLSVELMEKNTAVLKGYTPCMICGKEQGKYTYYYVTEEGQRYHTRLDCSGLKRTVYMIRLSEAAGRRACSRCGGG